MASFYKVISTGAERNREICSIVYEISRRHSSLRSSFCSRWHNLHESFIETHSRFYILSIYKILTGTLSGLSILGTVTMSILFGESSLCILSKYIWSGSSIRFSNVPQKHCWLNGTAVSFMTGAILSPLTMRCLSSIVSEIDCLSVPHTGITMSISLADVYISTGTSIIITV